MVNYDPAWDMPTQNWLQQGSYETGSLPPLIDPDAGTPVCIGPFAKEWLPWVLGAMDQLRNPSSWIVASDDVMFATLDRVTRLKEIFSQPGNCGVTYSLRFTDTCELQFTTDEGATWATVDGWNDNLCPCIKKCVPVVTLPPNPGDLPHDQLACAIAAYLADSVIRASLQKAIDNINSNLSLLDFGAAVITLIPEFVLVTLAYDAFTAIYTYISHGTISDYEDAVADDLLWVDVTCAIYNAIVGDGFVTPSNFPTIVSNISVISYVHADVISTIAAYVSDLGPTGLAQLSQRAGLNVGADCSTCGDTWCTVMDLKVSPYSTFNVTGYWTSGLGWHSIENGGGNADQLIFSTQATGGSGTVFDSVEVHYTRNGSTDIPTVWDIGSGVFNGDDHTLIAGAALANAPGGYVTVTDLTGYHVGASFNFSLGNRPLIGGTGNAITMLVFRGTGTAPSNFGEPC